MAHAAVATRTRHSPRRRHRPAAWERAGAMLVVVASVACFVDQRWIGPGEPVTAAAWILIALWILALAGTMARIEHPDPLQETS